MKVAFIGTGVMGKPMALHLSDNGYDVSVYNRTFSKAQALEPKCKAYETIKEVVLDKDVIFTIVGYPKDVEEVYNEVMKYAKKGAILVDMTTSSPTLAVKLYDKAKALGLHMIDAPVTGGDLGAINATLSIMVGGDEDKFLKVKPLLETMGKTITYMGKEGSGQHAKLANQTVIAGTIMGVAEALVYAKNKGLDLDDMLNVITGGSANSWQAVNNGKKMILNDYEPGFYVKHFLKDLNLTMDEKGSLDLKILENVRDAYQILLNNGYGDTGTQSIIEYYLQNMKK